MRRSSTVNVSCASKSQRSNMPASSTTRFNCSSPQRPRTPGRFSASTSRAVSLRRLWPIVSSDGDALHQLGASLHTAPLRVFDLAIDLIESLVQRRDQILDGFPARVDIGSRFGPCRAQPGFGEIEKRPAVRLERFDAQ